MAEFGFCETAESRASRTVINPSIRGGRETAGTYGQKRVAIMRSGRGKERERDRSARNFIAMETSVPRRIETRGCSAATTGIPRAPRISSRARRSTHFASRENLVYECIPATRAQSVNPTAYTERLIVRLTVIKGEMKLLTRRRLSSIFPS